MQAECSVCGGVGISVFSRLDMVRGQHYAEASFVFFFFSYVFFLLLLTITPGPGGQYLRVHARIIGACPSTVV